LRWLVSIGPDGIHSSRGDRPAQGTARSSSSDLYLLLGNRIPGDQLALTGDRSVPELWRRLVRVGW
jgi:hypothetical protein